MGKKRALARLCEIFNPAEMIEICESLHLPEKDARLIQERFYSGQSRELCDMPVGEQKRRVPMIEKWILAEVDRRKALNLPKG